MSVHEHRATTPDEPLNVGVVTISTSRTRAEDRSGDLIADRLVAAGHRLEGRKWVTDDVDAVRGAIRELRASGVVAIVCTGGTGLSARDVTPEALQPMFTRDIPGFGELFRVLSMQEVGSAAMLSRALAGLVDRTVVFALPGSTRACAMGMDRLVIPELGHILGQVEKEVASLVPEADPVQVHVAEDREASNKPTSVTEELPRPIRWHLAVQEMGGEVVIEPPPPLPEAINRLAPVAGLFASSGERGVLLLEGGRRLGLYGWPDLRRPSSKVIAVGEGGILAEILALHRHPVPHCTVVPNGVGSPPGTLSEVAEDVTGQPLEQDGVLFAVSSKAIWVQSGERALKWDGSELKDDGTCKQVLSTLLMDWHSR